MREGFLPVNWDVRFRPQGSVCPWLYLPGSDALRRVLWEEPCMDLDDQVYPVLLTIIDAMGHYTTEVYDFCLAHQGLVLPNQGKQQMNVEYSYSPVLHYPGTNRPEPGALKLLRGHTTSWKEKLSMQLRVAPTDPGAWHYHGQISEEWARGICAENKDQKTGAWVCPSGRANHSWAVAHYALIAADILGIRVWKREPEQAPPPPPGQPVNPYTGGMKMFGRNA